jgi:hypothetical protein
MNKMKRMGKMNKFERTAAFNEKRAAALAGTGVFLFKNNSRADIMLSKPTMEGYKIIGPGQQFRGDSFFLKQVGNGLALIRDETPKKDETSKNEGKIMAQEKLILDQPETVTTQGKVEMVKSPVSQKLNEVQPSVPEEITAKTEDVLINEDPMAGVEIMLKD